MNERIKQLAFEANKDLDGNVPIGFAEKFAELIVRDVMNEVFVVYPGGKKGSDVKFQNISPRQWINQVFGVEE